jgi:hypothetical protein
MNLPGLAEDHRSLRIPLFAIMGDMIAKGETYDDLFDVLAWSLRSSAIGKNPFTRHDSRNWLPSDNQRKAAASRQLPLAVLAEFRGDWKMLAEVLKLPSWQHKAGMCFKCKCTLDTLRQVGSDAPWRHERINHWQLMERLRQQMKTLSAIWKCPFFTSAQVLIDWLHCADPAINCLLFGVSCDFFCFCYGGSW